MSMDTVSNWDIVWDIITSGGRDAPYPTVTKVVEFGNIFGRLRWGLVHEDDPQSGYEVSSEGFREPVVIWELSDGPGIRV